MSRPLEEVISDIFTYRGAVVEKTKDGCLEFLAPQEFRNALGLPEDGILNFSYGDSSEETILATYDSDLFQSMGKLFTRNGRIGAVAYPPFEPNTSKLLKRIPEKVVFSNAIFHIEETQKRDIPYLLIFFRYTALSDVKQEGVIALMMNEINRSCVPVYQDVSEILSESSETKMKQDRAIEAPLNLLRVACSGASMMAKEELVDFIKSLERRLNRDIKRVYDYYETLKEETVRVIEKKRAIMEDSTETNKDKAPKGVGRLLSKLDAIETEQEWKTQDLISKYALKIEVEPVSVVRLETVSTVFWINLKRRLSTRRFPLTYNPIVRELDPLPCESCFYPRPGYYVCDDKLHIVCARCFEKCPQCGKQFCSACYTGRCPKCKKRKNRK